MTIQSITDSTGSGTRKDVSAAVPAAVPDPKRDIRISKSLSKLLRHQADQQGLSIDSKGFVPVAELLQHNYLKSNKTTFGDIQRVVINDNKKRYTLQNRADKELNRDEDEGNREVNDGSIEDYYICANQGHSIPTVETELIQLKTKQDFPSDIAVHGTTMKKFEQIRKSGALSKMSRNHIHFAKGLPEERDVISGMRPWSDVLMFLNIEKALNDGYVFYKSLNDVILSEGIDGKIPLEYFDIKFRDVHNK